MWERLRRFNKLSRAERRLFLRASRLLVIVAIRLRTRGYVKTKSWLDRTISLKSQTVQSEGQAEEVAAIARMVRAAARYSWRWASCLEQSLVLWSLLAREGISSELRVGVRKSEEKFEAHAWVEFNGDALNEGQTPHKHFAAFADALTNLPSRKP